MGLETESDGVPSYLQPDKESDLDAELNLPSAPIGQSAIPAGRGNGQVNFHSLLISDYFRAIALNALDVIPVSTKNDLFGLNLGHVFG